MYVVVKALTSVPQMGIILYYITNYMNHSLLLSSFLGSTAQLRPWPPPQNPAEFLGSFSKIFFFTG
jgi:hypothetical protein